MSETFDESYEHEEELSEMERLLKLQVEAFQNNPTMFQQLLHARGTSYLHGYGCGPCTRKLHFLQLVQTMTIINVLRTGESKYVHGLDWAWRVPAVRIMAWPNLLEAVSALTQWIDTDSADEYQPPWYDKGPMENEGGHI